MNRRIWELDAARGFALVCMIVVHLLYDLSDLFGLLPFALPRWYHVVKDYFGVVFLLISGISATLGSHPVKRGLQVFACGLLCSAVTYEMYRFGFADVTIVIYFGVLHCLGICMLLWAGLRKLPSWMLVLAGGILAAAGLYVFNRSYGTNWVLIPLGLTPYWFASSDYFPLLPHLGFFLLGAAAGRKLYPGKVSRFPNVPAPQWLCTMGRWSLPIYLLHQPVLVALVYGLDQILTR